VSVSRAGPRRHRRVLGRSSTRSAIDRTATAPHASSCACARFRAPPSSDRYSPDGVRNSRQTPLLAPRSTGPSPKSPTGPHPRGVFIVASWSRARRAVELRIGNEMSGVLFFFLHGGGGGGGGHPRCRRRQMAVAMNRHPGQSPTSAGTTRRRPSQPSRAYRWPEPVHQGQMEDAPRCRHKRVVTGPRRHGRNHRPGASSSARAHNALARGRCQRPRSGEARRRSNRTTAARIGLEMPQPGRSRGRPRIDSATANVPSSAAPQYGSRLTAGLTPGRRSGGTTRRWAWWPATVSGRSPPPPMARCGSTLTSPADPAEPRGRRRRQLVDSCRARNPDGPEGWPTGMPAATAGCRGIASQCAGEAEGGTGRGVPLSQTGPCHARTAEDGRTLAARPFGGGSGHRRPAPDPIKG